MKKSILIILFAVLTVTLAQAQPFQKGTTMTNLGIGLGTGLGGLGTARPAINLAVDHGAWELGGPGVVSIGGYLGNTGYKYEGSGYTAKWNYFVIGARGAYHYNGFSAPELDVYGGLMLGYNVVKYSSDGNDGGIANNYGSGMGVSGFVGGRWLFTENVGAFAELGFGVSILNLGVTFKL